MIQRKTKKKMDRLPGRGSEHGRTELKWEDVRKTQKDTGGNCKRSGTLERCHEGVDGWTQLEDDDLT